MTTPRPLSDADLLAWAVVLEYRRRQTHQGLKVLLLTFPPCPTCKEPVTEAKTWWVQDPVRYDGVITMEPCGHSHGATAGDMERIHDHASEMLDQLRYDAVEHGLAGSCDGIVREAQARLGEPKQTATEATALDKSRRYLRPVAAMPISEDPRGVHLAVYEWLPAFEAWATGPGLCGESMKQGALPEGTVVTCARCEEWRPRYERMLAPGYRPEDDDPEALRRRAETAEQQRDAAADALAAEWHRRNQRLEELTKSNGPEAQVAIVEHVRGELVGLRGALGILLGGQVQDGTADLLGWAHYQEWRRRQGDAL